MRDNQSILRDFIEQFWNVGDLDTVETFVAPEWPSNAKVWT